jgi:predicted AlkP superfamily phosphohydrolase/phosphomutase
MAKYYVKLRYYVGDPLEEIREKDLKTFEQEYGLDISYDHIEKREMKDGILQEDTMNSHIEDITQEVITVSGEDEKKFSDCIIALYKKYRCPRTAYSLLGSNEAGHKIAWDLMDPYGGWE